MPPSLPRALRAFPILLGLAACSEAGPTSPPPVDGFWRSRGYGLVVQIAGDSLRSWEVTTTTCVPSFNGVRVASPDSTAPAFEIAQRGTVTLLPGDSGTRRVHTPGMASDMVLERVESAGAACEHPTPDTPDDDFEVFTRTWTEHYILFDQKDIDWAAEVARARARVTDSTTPAALFDLLQGLIEPFHDAHTLILAPSLDRRYSGLRPGTERFVAHGVRGFLQEQLPRITAITDRYLAGPIRTFCHDKVQYGVLNDSTGYLRLLSFSGYADGPFEAELAALETALDTMMTDLAGRKRLIIDVRINTGGADPLGLAIASRLATAPYVAYTKEARADPVDRNRWTAGQPSRVEPSDKPSFRGEVVELTGPFTISAGETFTQALMGRAPKVIRIGENTQGVFSDVLIRQMPNGWRFGLPNEVFRTADGKTFDGAGIPPDIAVPVFQKRDLAAGRDPALERALERLP